MNTPPTLPRVRSVPFTQPLVWLVLGWRDLTHTGWVSVAHGLVIALGGALIVAVAHHRFWLLAGALSGFLVIAPVLATSLYALSRALERERKANFSVVLKTWTNWQGSHFSKWGNDYWCMVQFGTLLAIAATGWVLTSAALITLFAPAPILTPLDFIHHVVLARDGVLFELWLALGGLLAAPMFASSVISMPLLLDRRITLWGAVFTSWQAVLANPVLMAVWGALIMLLTLLGLATLMLGLIVIIPVLGHASWHAYRDLVDCSDVLPRDSGPAPLNSRW
jgi:uncharacterized membrane protein